MKRYVLVGHSLGGSIATELMNVGDPRVAGVVLVDSGPSSDYEVAAYLREQLIEGHAIFDSVADYARWMTDRRPLLSPAVAQQLAERCLMPVPEGFQPRYDVEVARGGVEEDESLEWWMARLRNCIAPVLLVRGAGSAVLTRSMAALMVSTLKNGTLVTVSHAGHGIMSDNPRGFADAVKPFLMRCLARTMSSSFG